MMIKLMIVSYIFYINFFLLIVYSKIKEITDRLDSFDSKINNLSSNINQNKENTDTKVVTFDSSALNKSIKDL